VSPAYHLHPEFGLLCPSGRFRRRARFTFAFVAFLLIVGALALKVGHAPDADGAAMVAQGGVARTNLETVQTVGHAAAATTFGSSTALEASATACQSDRPGYVDVKCSAVKVRRVLSPRAANEAAIIAAVPLGRSVLPAPTSSATSLNPADAANTVVSTPVIADLSGAPATAPKRVRKPSRRNGGHDFSRDRGLSDREWSARAYASPYNPYLRGRYERSWGWSW
jgi:hypothetical protein